MILLDKFDFSLLSIPKIKLHIRYFFPLLFGSKNFEVDLEGVKLSLRPRTFDLYIVAEIFSEKSYSIPQLNNKNLDVIVDLGANIGIFTIWAAKNYSPKKVISVEMDGDNFNLLNQNIANNRGKLSCEFVTINKAVYSSKTNLSYEKVPINKGMHVLKEVQGSGNSVETITLEEIAKNNNLGVIDLLKIDIEGSEKYLLNAGNNEFFKKQVKYVTMEVHVGEDFKISDVEKYFAELGFKSKIFKSWTSINYLFYAESTNP